MSDSTKFSEPVIFHKLSQLYLAVHERIERFPKTSRYSLGPRIENTVLEVMELCYLAQGKSGPSQLLILNKVDIKLKVLASHLRIASKTKCISDGGFAELSEKNLEIGRIIGGWIKATKACSTKP